MAYVGFAQGLIKTPVKGGPEFTLVDKVPLNPNYGASWGDDNTIVFANRAGLYRVSAEGGEPELMIAPQAAKGEQYFADPQVLPGSQSILIAIVPQETTAGAQVAVFDVTTRTARALFRGGNKPRYLRSGHLVYAAEKSLEARRFDLTSLEVSGDAVPLGISVDDALNYDLSPSGTLAYFSSVPPRASSTLVWVDREGREELFAEIGVPPNYPRISPDGRSVAVDVNQNPKRDVWLIDVLNSSLFRPFIAHANLDQQPVWSHDGRYLAFASDRDSPGTLNVYRQPADGSGEPERLYSSSTRQVPHDYPSASQLLIVYDGPGNTGTNIGLLTLGSQTTFKP